MINHILVVAVSFILSTLVVFTLIGFGLGWELITSRPTMLVGRDGQTIGFIIILVLVIGLTSILVQGGIYLLKLYLSELLLSIPTQ